MKVEVCYICGRWECAGEEFTSPRLSETHCSSQVAKKRKGSNYYLFYPWMPENLRWGEKVVKIDHNDPKYRKQVERSMELYLRPMD